MSYSNKDNINLLTALLAAHHVRHAVVCPGSRNAPIVHNLHAHPDIACCPVTDERSAGFYALGLAQATGKAAAVCVTSGSALLGVLPAVGGLCFGLVMIIKAHLFDGILQMFMALLLIVLGLFHIIYLFLSRDSLKTKGWYHLCPVIVALCGILSLVVPSLRENVPVVVLITGICLLLFNFTSLQEYLAERRVRRAITQPTDNQVVENHPIAVDDKIIEPEQ